MEDSLITVKEVSDYLKLKDQTVYLLARQKKIPSLKIGGSLRFKKSQIDAWLLAKPKKDSAEVGRSKVLIVDDEKIVRDTLQRIVESYGIPAVTVSGGLQAVEAAKRESFRIVFLDLNMPQINGVQTLCALKAVDQELVFVVVTGIEGEDDLFRSAIELTPVSVIPKPFSSQQVGDALELYFDNVVRPEVPSTPI